MNRVNLGKIKKGTRVSFSLYKDVEYVGKTKENVVLKDKNGNKMEVGINIFERYGFLVGTNSKR